MAKNHPKNPVELEEVSAVEKDAPEGSADQGSPQQNAPTKGEGVELAGGVVLPPWMARDMECFWLSKTLRASAEGFVAPLYEELVLNAEDALERTAGEMLVFLEWAALIQKDRLSEQSLERSGYRKWPEFDALLDKVLKVCKDQARMLALVDRLRASAHNRRLAAGGAGARRAKGGGGASGKGA